MERQNNTTRTVIIIIILMPPNECPHILQSRPRLSRPVMCVFVLVYPISAVAMSKGVGNTRRATTRDQVHIPHSWRGVQEYNGHMDHKLGAMEN